VTAPASRRSPEPGVRYQLGGDLRQLREGRRLRLEDAAAHLGVASSTLSRIETGKSPARICFVNVLLDLYGVDDADRRAVLAEMAREGQREPWWARYRDALPASVTQCLSLESAARRVRCYATQAMPDLLQTPDYATAACRAARSGLTSEQVSILAELHGQRQELMRTAGCQLHLIIDECALARPIAPADVIAAQLSHLLIAARDKATTVQVIAAQPGPALICPAFTLLDFAHQASPAGYSHGPGGHVTMAKGGGSVQAMETMFDALAAAALSPEASARLIAETRSRLRVIYDEL
jgi:transcriptional regulator with XRE-family HTH domain